MGSHKVPLIGRDILERDGTHLTMRVERSTRRIVHRPIGSFDLEEFAATYLPVRESANFRQRRNRIGYLWMSKLGQLRAFESLLEQSILLDLDRDPSVRRVWSQPFRVDGLDPNRGGRYVRPTPDLLIEDHHEKLQVVEVKPKRRVDYPDESDYAGNLEGFEKAVRRWQRLGDSLKYQSEQLGQIDISVAVRSELPEARRKNLEYLALYRRPLPKNDSLAETVLDAAAHGPVEVIDLAEEAGGFVAAMPVVMHLVWHRHLHIDLDEPLNTHTIVHSAAMPALKAAA